VVRTLTRDPRRLWLTLWLFCLGNWQDQDYLSPQAFSFLLFLVVLALVLGPLQASAPGLAGRSREAVLVWWAGRTPAEPDPRRRVAALGAAIVLLAVVSGSHQLTPFMLVMALLALTIAGRLWAPGLTVLALLAVGLWLAYPASPYLMGHPPLEDIGLGPASATVTERVAGSPGHVDVVRLRMVLAGLLWVAAVAGIIADRRRGRLDSRPALLMACPFALLPFQSYGGEMLIRASLFALPFTAYLAAGALLAGRRQGRGAVAALLAFALLSPLFLVARYGNARFDMFTDAELAAAQKLHELAPPAAAIISGAHPTPWRNQGYTEHTYRTVQDLCREGYAPDTCGQTVHNYAGRHTGGALILLNRASKASMEMQGMLSNRDFDAFEEWLGRKSTVHLVYDNPDARIYRIESP
jgi:hypothetical protein